MNSTRTATRNRRGRAGFGRLFAFRRARPIAATETPIRGRLANRNGRLGEEWRVRELENAGIGRRRRRSPDRGNAAEPLRKCHWYARGSHPDGRVRKRIALVPGEWPVRWSSRYMATSGGSLQRRKRPGGGMIWSQLA
ncbi:MAG: hypothetical protein OXN84_16270 [Albidovulum sp.]|nr:hypothetical protein [Albidovulum sp.]